MHFRTHTYRNFFPYFLTRNYPPKFDRVFSEHPVQFLAVKVTLLQDIFFVKLFIRAVYKKNSVTIFTFTFYIFSRTKAVITFTGTSQIVYCVNIMSPIFAEKNIEFVIRKYIFIYIYRVAYIWLHFDGVLSFFTFHVSGLDFNGWNNDGDILMEFQSY